MAQQTQSQKSSSAKKQTAAAKAALAEPMEKQHKEQDVTSKERYDMIAEAAYRIAEQRNFQGDMAMDDWLQAEEEVNARYMERH